jgi:ribonuclease P protein component
MLPAQRRVRHRDDFSAAVRQGRRLGASGLVLHLRNDASTSPARAGFIVGRAVGPAVRRNRLRRQLRHLIAPRLELLAPGTVVIVRATAPAAEQSGAALAATLDGLLTRARTAATA